MFSREKLVFRLCYWHRFTVIVVVVVVVVVAVIVVATVVVVVVIVVVVNELAFGKSAIS